MKKNQEITNELSSIETEFSTLLTENFEHEIDNCITCTFDKETGEINTKCDWIGISGAIANEVNQCYIRFKKADDVAKAGPKIIKVISECINIPQSIKLGIAAKRRTKIVQECYSKYILSGKYKADILRFYVENKNKENLILAIRGYVKEIVEELERTLENV